MQPNNSKLLLTIAFVSGMCVMAMEITSSRILAPYFGSSLFVWTNIIGVVMISLSLGYYFGGKLSEKRPDIKLLLKLLLVAGVFFMSVPWIIRPFALFLTDKTVSFNLSFLGLFAGSLILAVVMFAIPLLLLGMVSPFIIKLYSLERNDIGEVSGKVFAISTVGSILGTFLPTLYFIPFWGSIFTVYFFSCLLILLALWGLISNKKKILWFILIFIPLIKVSAIDLKPREGLLYEGESVYQFIQIYEDEMKNRYLYTNEGLGHQSVLNHENPLTGYYYDYFTLLLNFFDKDTEKDVLILGLSGGTISSQMDHYWRGTVSIDGVEIDKKLINAAREHFDLENPSLKIYNQDARVFLQNTDKKYDLIIVDAYAQEMYIPWTMTTKEFWQEVISKLSAKGMVAININAINENSLLLKSMMNTMSVVFENTYWASISDFEVGNYIAVSSQKEFDFKKLPNLVSQEDFFSLSAILGDRIQKYDFDPKVMVLNDNHAPVEFMTDGMIYKYIFKNIFINHYTNQ